MLKNYVTRFVAFLAIFSASIATSASVLAQCSASAGNNFSTCQSGPIQLNGTFVASPVDPVLNINQSDNNTCMANFSQTNLAQSFTATAATSCGAGLTFSDMANGNLVISLWTALPNAGGTMLATGTALVSNSLVGDVYWSSVPTTIGTMYYLVFETSSPQIFACVAGSTNNPYAGGLLYANAGYGPFQSFDYTFRTYSCGASVDLSWTGPNIVSGANTATPTINPPAPGQYTYTFTVTDNATNCTATSQVTVTRNESSFIQEQVDACNLYVWNNQTYTTSGVYQQVFQNQSGCDSTVSLNLSIINYTVMAINNENGTLSATPGSTFQWVTCPNLTPIPGATSQIFSPTQNGTYAVIAVSPNGCQSVSNCVTISQVGIENYNALNVIIYPNPTDDFFRIDFEGGEAQVEILDAQGKIIQTKTINSGEELSLENCSSGVFFIRISTENATSVHRVVKR